MPSVEDPHFTTENTPSVRYADRTDKELRAAIKALKAKEKPAFEVLPRSFVVNALSHEIPIGLPEEERIQKLREEGIDALQVELRKRQVIRKLEKLVKAAPMPSPEELRASLEQKLRESDEAKARSQARAANPHIQVVDGKVREVEGWKPTPHAGQDFGAQIIHTTNPSTGSAIAEQFAKIRALRDDIQKAGLDKPNGGQVRSLGQPDTIPVPVPVEHGFWKPRQPVEQDDHAAKHSEVVYNPNAHLEYMDEFRPGEAREPITIQVSPPQMTPEEITVQIDPNRAGETHEQFRARSERLYQIPDELEVRQIERHLVIGIGGKLRAGKDTVADYLVAHYGFGKTYMSEPLQAALYTLDPWIVSPVPLSVPAEKSVQRYRELADDIGYTEAKKIPEVRRLLQVLGTEVGREQLGQDTWVNAARKKIEELREHGPVVLTGVRYPNEAEMIQELGGILVWVERPEEPNLLGTSTTSIPIQSIEGSEDPSKLHAHSSETSLGRDDFHIRVINDSTLAMLHARTDALMTTLAQIKAGTYQMTEEFPDGDDPARDA